MAEQEHIIDVDIDEEDIDESITRRTVKVTIEKKDYVYRKDVFDLFVSIFGNGRVVEAIAKREKSEEWFVTVKSETAYEQCLKQDSRVYKGRKFYFSDASKCVVNLRVHWVSRDYKNGFLKKVFSRYGEVRSVREETSNIEGFGVMNGLRHVTLVCTDSQAGNIPHMIRLCKGRVRMLVTAPGRLPLCLRCNCIGHVAASCVQGRSEQSRPLFTEVLNGRRSPPQVADIETKKNDEYEERKGSDDSDDDSTDSEKGALVIDETRMDETSGGEGMESVVGETGSGEGEPSISMEEASSVLGESSSVLGEASSCMREASSCMRETDSGNEETSVIKTGASGNKRRSDNDQIKDNKKTKSGAKGGKGSGKKK
ncbi:hypothetical protein SNE40_003396 [Patella caerulea]|uniref:Uncharacterized protein n=1 Tax=Patella caerulea TaxID=87958 RepID=A0AAN8KI26_PATCE